MLLGNFALASLYICAILSKSFWVCKAKSTCAAGKDIVSLWTRLFSAVCRVGLRCEHLVRSGLKLSLNPELPIYNLSVLGNSH